MNYLIIGVALGLVSFLSSTFVLFRILLPILPRHPLSRRVAPPGSTFRILSPADKVHLYLAAIDILALAIFVWEVVAQQNKTATYNLALHGAHAARLWFATTARQTCLCIILILAAIRIRQGHIVSLGKCHWLLVAPTVIIVAASTAMAGAMGVLGVPSLFIGISVYSVVVTLLSVLALLVLVRTIMRARRCLSALEDTWPPLNEKPHGSFATEDVEALKDGSSWITSHRSSISVLPMSEWSFPASRPASLVAESHQILPDTATTAVFSPELKTSACPISGHDLLEKGQRLDNLSSGTLVAASDAPTSTWRTLGWLSTMVVPNVLALPFALASILRPTTVPEPLFALFIVSIVISSPLLALNVFFHSPMPLPVTLFPTKDRQSGATARVVPRFRSMSTFPKGSSRAQTPTVVDSHRSGDIWLKPRDATDGSSRIERIFAMTARVPKLSIMPDECIREPEAAAPLPTQRDDLTIGDSENSQSVIEQVGDTNRQGILTHDDSSMLSVATSQHKILTAQRHVSAKAITLRLSPSPGPYNVQDFEKQLSVPTQCSHSHQYDRYLRSRSEPPASQEQLPASPVSHTSMSPLPQTPKHLRVQPGHKRRDTSASQYSFSPISTTNQIDRLSAAMLPMLVPGLEISNNMIREDDEWTAGLQTVLKPCSDPPLVQPLSDLPEIRAKTSGSKKFAQSIRKGLGSLGRSNVVSTLRRSMSLSFSPPENHSTRPPLPTHMQQQGGIRRVSRSMTFQHDLPSNDTNVISEPETALKDGMSSVRLVAPTEAKSNTQHYHSKSASDALTSHRWSRSRSRLPVLRSHSPTLLKNMAPFPSIGMDPSGLCVTPASPPSTASVSSICPDSPQDDASVYSQRCVAIAEVASQQARRIPPGSPTSIGSSTSPWDDTLSAARVSITSSNSGDSPEEWMHKKLRHLRVLHDRDSNIFVPRAEISDNGKRTLPLVIKKTRARKLSDENSIVSIGSQSRSSKQLRLIRPVTTKPRAQWQDPNSPSKLSIVHAQSDTSTFPTYDH